LGYEVVIIKHGGRIGEVNAMFLMVAGCFAGIPTDLPECTVHKLCIRCQAFGLETLFSMAGMELAGRTDFQGTPGSLWMTGRLSPEAQRQFDALGWMVYLTVLPPWQR
jgi:hypothetical protein